MSYRGVDLTGQIFSSLTVVARMGSTQRGAALWSCVCVCGTPVTARGDNLKSGHTTSCGCARVGRPPPVAGRREPVPVAKPRPAARIQVQLFEGRFEHLSFGFGVAHLPAPDGFEPGEHEAPVFILPPYPRQHSMGPISTTLRRMMQELAKAGHISPRGERTYGVWMRDERVTASTVMRSQDDVEIRAAHAKVATARGLWIG